MNFPNFIKIWVICMCLFQLIDWSTIPKLCPSLYTIWKLRYDMGYHRGLSTLTKYHWEAAGLQEFFHHSDIVSCFIFHIKKVPALCISCKVCRDVLKFYEVYRNSWFSEGGTVLTETIVVSFLLVHDAQWLLFGIIVQKVFQTNLK